MDVTAGIKAWVFDAYGTLFQIGALDESLERYYGEKATVMGQIWRSKQLEYTWLRTLMGKYEPFSTVTADALRFACNVTNSSLSPEVEADLIRQYYVLKAFPEVKDLFAQLSQRYTLAVLSNANSHMLQEAVNANGLSPFLSHVLSVEEVRAFKPSPAVYQLAVDRLNIFSHEIGFISTNTWDVAGATAFGLRAVHLNRFEKQQDEVGVEKAPTIWRLEELL